jgi:hypothetical protein
MENIVRLFVMKYFVRDYITFSTSPCIFSDYVLCLTMKMEITSYSFFWPFKLSISELCLTKIGSYCEDVWWNKDDSAVL